MGPYSSDAIKACAGGELNCFSFWTGFCLAIENYRTLLYAGLVLISG